MDRQPRVLVVGDFMWDIYHFGTMTRISPEAPIPIVTVSETKVFHGGAGNVTRNLEALGANVVSVSGMVGMVEENRYQAYPSKHRILVGEHQVARYDLDDIVQPIHVNQLDSTVRNWPPDAIVVSDYGKGSVSEEVMIWVMNQQLPTFIDTKQNPSWFWKGHRQDYVTFFPNRVEYLQYERSYQLCQNVVLKLGADGVKRLIDGKLVEHFPAYAKQVVSVCGAGDTILAAYVYYNCPPGHPDALFRASIAAAVVVEKPWTATASVAEIEERIKCLDTKKG
jgi:bifunctional ADP-heptose synthase (sugar kinase/adenylyltransferase)